MFRSLWFSDFWLCTLSFERDLSTELRFWWINSPDSSPLSSCHRLKVILTSKFLNKPAYISALISSQFPSAGHSLLKQFPPSFFHIFPRFFVCSVYLQHSLSPSPTLRDNCQFGVSVWLNGRSLKSATRIDARSDRKSSEVDHPKLTPLQIRGQILKSHTLTMPIQKCWVHRLQVKPTQGQRQQPLASFVRGLIKPSYKRFSLAIPWLLQQIL